MAFADGDRASRAPSVCCSCLVCGRSNFLCFVTELYISHLFIVPTLTHSLHSYGPLSGDPHAKAIRVGTRADAGRAADSGRPDSKSVAQHPLRPNASLRRMRREMLRLSKGGRHVYMSGCYALTTRVTRAHTPNQRCKMHSKRIMCNHKKEGLSLHPHRTSRMPCELVMGEHVDGCE